MSIELPAIPAAPNEDSTPEQWARYLQIVALHNSAASTQAIRDQTAQMALMTAAAQANATLMQQLLAQPQTTSSGFSESFVMSLLRLVLEKPEPAGG